MKVFCPNCGAQQEGMPGGRLTCMACTTSFEVPREGAVAPEPRPPASPLPTATTEGDPKSAPFPTQLDTQLGPPPPSLGAPTGGQTNPLAVVSLVLGFACCIPFASVGAIVTGVVALQQIARSGGQQGGKELAVGGIVLGCLSFTLGLIGFLANILSWKG